MNEYQFANGYCPSIIADLGHYDMSCDALNDDGIPYWKDDNDDYQYCNDANEYYA